MLIHYHGTPITPRSELLLLAGRNFCVSYVKPQDVKTVHQIGQSVMLDNGAFTAWRQGKEIDWTDWARWVEPWLDYRTTWCVLPDAVDGGVEENDNLLREWRSIGGAPVWHLHEPLARLIALCEDYDRVCFGSSGSYREVGSDAWHRRMTEAFNLLDKSFGRFPWLHMLRGMSMSGDIYPFASVDSTDVGRNHNREHNSVRTLADRWDGLQCPARWAQHDQLSFSANG